MPDANQKTKNAKADATYIFPNLQLGVIKYSPVEKSCHV